MREKPPLQALGTFSTLPSTILEDIFTSILNRKRKAVNFAFAWSGAHCTDKGRKIRFQNRFSKA